MTRISGFAWFTIGTVALIIAIAVCGIGFIWTSDQRWVETGTVFVNALSWAGPAWLIWALFRFVL